MKKLLMLTLCFISTIVVFAQEQDPEEIEKQLNFILKESAKPDVYIDGQKYPYEIVNLIDNSKIKSVTVVKDTAELKENDHYKEYNAKYGLILIETNKPSIKIQNKDGLKDPLIIVDGVVKEKGDLDLTNIDQKKIESISVLKGEKALEEYNAPNGVVIIKMKK